MERLRMISHGHSTELEEDAQHFGQVLQEIPIPKYVLCYFVVLYCNSNSLFSRIGFVPKIGQIGSSLPKGGSSLYSVRQDCFLPLKVTLRTAAAATAATATGLCVCVREREKGALPTSSSSLFPY